MVFNSPKVINDNSMNKVLNSPKVINDNSNQVIKSFFPKGINQHIWLSSLMLMPFGQKYQLNDLFYCH